MSAEAGATRAREALRRPFRPSNAWSRWTAGWLGGSVLGIANGVIRDLFYKDRVGELAAHQISTGTLIALLAGYFAVLERRWPLATRREAVCVGGSWLTLTILFEFGFGHYVDGKSWDDLLADYDLADGHLWSLVLLWTATGPGLVRAAATRRSP